MDMNILQQLTLGGMFAIVILAVVFGFLLRYRQKNGNDLSLRQGENEPPYAGPERRQRLAGNEPTDWWERRIAEESLKAVMQATQTVVLPILKAMQVSINQTQKAIESLAVSQAGIEKILEVLKDRGDKQAISEAVAAEMTAQQARAHGAGSHRG